jgi:hypothetical protein
MLIIQHVKTETNKANKTNTDNKEASAFTLSISIITYIINNKVIYSPRPSLKIACSFCSLVRICFVTLKQQKQQAKTRQALCLIYIINYHNDLIIKYKKCTSSSLKNKCCFCCFCCICGKYEKTTLFHAKKNCLSWHEIQSPRKTPLFCPRIASNVSDVHLYRRGKNLRPTVP